MPIYQFNGYKPVIKKTSFVHPTASVIGNVIIGNHVYVGPGAVIRGDWGEVIIEDGCNIQETCVIHMFPGTKVWLKENAHIGHGAIIHGATIGTNCLIGMNAVLMDDAVVEDNSIIGALSFVPTNTTIPTKSLAVGNPIKIIKEVSDEMLEWKKTGTELYQKLPADCFESLEECEALTEVEENRPKQKQVFKKWK